MDIVNQTPFAFAMTVGRVGFPGYSLTLIVKATYALTPGELTPIEEQPTPTGDEFRDDSEAELRYESDFAPFKARADLLLVGRCVPPEPTAACPVTFRVGSHTGSLAVFGDRRWRSRMFGLARTRSAPQSFSEMPLTYARAFGGTGDKRNPEGRGRGGNRQDALPNIEDPRSLIQAPSDRPGPVCFAPEPRAWSRRAALMGTFGQDYAETRWPWYPEDFDFAHFNAAAPAMQTDYLAGDEEVFLQNINPEHPKFTTRLPGRRVRCLVERVVDGEQRTIEPTMHLDTLWIDSDVQRLVLVWRGHVEVADEDCDDVERILINAEPVGEPPAELKLPEAEAPEVEEVEPEEAAEAPEPKPLASEAAIAEMFEEHGALFDQMSPEAVYGSVPPAMTIEQQAEQLRALGFDSELISEMLAEEPPAPEEGVAVEAPAIEPGADLAGADLGGAELPGAELSGADLSGADLSKADLSGADLSGAELGGMKAPEAKLAEADLSGASAAEASFIEADMSGAKLSGADLSGADLSGAELAGADLSGADLTGAKLAGADLSGANLTDALLDQTDLTGATMTGAMAERASFHQANLSGVAGGGAVLAGADLSQSKLDQASFVEADFYDASLEGASGEAVQFARSRLSGVRAASASLPGLKASGAEGPGSIWNGAVLIGADFSGAVLTDADFARARLGNARFARAELTEARFRKCDAPAAVFTEANLMHASFERAGLSGAELSRANLYGAELAEARLDGAVMNGANLAMTKLEGRAHA